MGIMNTIKNLNLSVLIFISILLVFIVFWGWHSKKSRKKKRMNTPKVQCENYSLQECKSHEDIEFKVDTYQRSLNQELEKNKQIIKTAKRKGYIKANIEWTDRFQEFTNVSNTLYKNLEYENARKLSADKFHRYTSLHYRSVLLGNIAYEDYMDSKRGRDEIGELLVAIGKKQVKVSPEEKRELYEIKDTYKNTTKYLYDRMIAVQRKTAELREKIGVECGQRGREWHTKIMRNR